MSRCVNKAMLIGNIGADPELRTTSSGTRVATFSLATSRRRTRDGGEDRTDWHRVVAWHELADIVGRVRRGDRVYVEGSLEYRSWQDAGGRTRYASEINAEDVIPLLELPDTPVWRAEDAEPGMRARFQLEDDLPF